MPGVLIVEDQPAVSRALAILFEVHDIPCEVVRTPAEAVSRVAGGGIGCVVQDMNFGPAATSGEEGIALFRKIREVDPAMPVMLMTAWTSLETAVALVREGANDYLAKPWDDAKLVASARTLLTMRALQLENDRLKKGRAESRAELAARYNLCGLIYENDAMQRLAAFAVQVAAADVPVLITGPNGAGKEKIAEIVQANSRRRDKPFIRSNAGALPDELLESELFGAEPGAYTGALKLRIGRFEAADGGTLFLDEIGTLSAAAQIRLLRVLETGEFERLGSSQTRRVDVRVVCATNADLKRSIAEGRFREDLYFRLNVVELAVPALKDRADDILPIAQSMLAAIPSGGGPLTLAPAAQQALLGHAWPGNVRELGNALQRAALLASSGSIEAADLGLAGPGAPASAASGPVTAERREIEDLLKGHGGSVSQAAVSLGLSRQALYRKMERLGIVLERRPRD